MQLQVWSTRGITSETHKKKKRVRALPSEIVEATEDRRMCWFLALLAANSSALTTLLQVGSDF